VDRDLLGNRDMPLHECTRAGDNPDIAPYLVLGNLGKKIKDISKEGLPLL
jgi:hypothetical protein